MFRTAVLEDLKDLLSIENDCWSPTLRATEDTIRNRILTYPEGQFIAEVNGKVCGVLYTQRIDDVECMISAGFGSQQQHHVATGRYAQLLAINVRPGTVTHTYIHTYIHIHYNCNASIIFINQ